MATLLEISIRMDVLASGAMGQRTTVIPSHDLVIVRQGYNPEPGAGGHLTRVIAAVVDVVRGSVIN